VADALTIEIKRTLATLTEAEERGNLEESLKLTSKVATLLSEKRDHALAALLIKCHGCGSHIRSDHAVKKDESWDTDCIRCTKCSDNPELRAAYDRGFDDGLDAAAVALQGTVTKSNLRKSNQHNYE